MWLAVVLCVSASDCVRYDGSTGGLANRIRALTCAVHYARSKNMSLNLEQNERHGLTHIINFDSFGIERPTNKDGCVYLNEHQVFRILPFNTPLYVPILPHVVQLGLNLLKQLSIKAPFACAHHRTFEKGPIQSFKREFYQFKAQCGLMRILVIHDGHIIPDVEPSVMLWGPKFLHKHGQFRKDMDFDTMASVVACSFASRLLLRYHSTMSNLIQGLAYHATPVVYYK